MKHTNFCAIIFALATSLTGVAVAQPTDPNWPRSAWHDDMQYERTQGFTREGWNGSGTKQPHQFNIVSAPYPVRYGTHSERFEIRPNDNNAMRDLGVINGNRSELLQRPNRQNARIGDDAWYGWSFYHENLFAADNSYGWYPMLGQWKTDFDAPPVIAFTPAFDGGPMREYMGIHLNDLSRGKGENWMAENKFGYPCTRLFHIRISTGKWMDIVVNTNFSDGEDGYLNVWINTCLWQLFNKPTTVLCHWLTPSAVTAWVCCFTYPSFGMSFAPTGVRWKSDKAKRIAGS